MDGIRHVSVGGDRRETVKNNHATAANGGSNMVVGKVHQRKRLVPT